MVVQQRKGQHVFVCLLVALKPQEWLLLIDYADELANTEIRRLSPPHLKPQTTPVAGEGRERCYGVYRVFCRWIDLYTHST